MEQLRAISFCSRPRSYRKRNTSLIFRMDRAFWDIRFLLQPEEKSPFGCPAPLSAPTQKARSRNVNINPGSNPPLSSRFGLFTSPESLFTCPESLFTSSRNLYSHRPGIGIHMPRNTQSPPQTRHWRSHKTVAEGD